MILGTIKKSIKKIKLIIKQAQVLLIVLLAISIIIFFCSSKFQKLINDGVVINTAKDGVIEPLTGVNTRAGAGYSAGDVPATGPITAEGRAYYMYYQWTEEYKNYEYGDSTLYEAGCGVFSGATCLSGVVGEQVAPERYLENVKEYFPNCGSYYIAGTGSAYPGIYTSSFLEEYYGVESFWIEEGSNNESKGLEYIDKGYPVIVSRPGHILAAIPLPDEYKDQGYRFFVLDSIKDATGPYTSAAEFAQKNGVDYLCFRYALVPLEDGI